MNDTLMLENLSLLPETRDFFEAKTSRAIPVFIASVCALLLAFVVWASVAPMDDVVKADAVIRPVLNTSSVKAAGSGQVAKIFYHQNQTVRKGDLLIALNSEAAQAELENINRRLGKAQEEASELTLMLRSMRELKNYCTPGTSSFLQTESFLSEHERQKGEVDKAYSDYVLESELPEAIRVRQLVEEKKFAYSQLELSFSTWKNSQLHSAEIREEEYEAECALLATQKKSAEQVLQNSSILSPIDGTVDEIVALNEGDYVFAGSEILRIIPSDSSNVKAELIVDAAYIARVEKNQRIKLRFPGLPPSQFGQVDAYVSSIPADMNVVGNKAVFIVNADIPNPYLTDSRKNKFLLRPGLSAQARVIVAHGSVLRMILRKLDFVQ